MSTQDVPGANPANKDVLAMGCWAEHADGSLVFVEAVEGGDVVYSIFDVDALVEYRDSMPEVGFKNQFTWKPESKRRGAKAKAPGTEDIRWTWHDKTPFPWDRVMTNFPAGSRAPSAVQTLSAAQRVATSLGVRAQAIRERSDFMAAPQRAATSIMGGILNALKKLRP